MFHQKPRQRKALGVFCFRRRQGLAIGKRGRIGGIFRAKPIVGRMLPGSCRTGDPGRVGLWGLRSEGAVQSDALEPHLRYLVAQLGPPRLDLRVQLAVPGAHARFFCYWVNETGDRVPDDIRALMESIGGTIETDKYR